MNETIEHGIQSLKNRAVELGIEGYFDGVSDNEILVLALYRYEEYLKQNWGTIQVDMEIDELDESDEVYCMDCGLPEDDCICGMEE